MKRYSALLLCCTFYGAAGAAQERMQIHSDAFTHYGPIPVRYTCDAEDRSPPLTWTALPKATRSLALIVDDPDAPDPATPRLTWVHWVVFNLPPTSVGLAEGTLPTGSVQGANSWGRTVYAGPCPPIGRHRYFFKLYALNARLNLRGSTDKAMLERAMQAHVLAQAELVGTYQRP